MHDPHGYGRDTPVMILTCAISPPERLVSALCEAERLVGRDRIVVIDGMVASDPSIRDHFDGRRAWLLSKRPPTDSEIAVYETHRRAWQRLVDGPWRQVLIVEDDFRVQYPALVRDCLANASALLADGRDVVKLFDYPRRVAGDKAILAVMAGIPLVKWRRPRAGMVAYLISRVGAEKFLTRRRFFRVVDEDIRYFWELGLDVWSLPVNAIVDASIALGGSTIERERQGARRRRSPMRTLHGMVISMHRKLVNAHVFGREIRAACRRGFRYGAVPDELVVPPT